MNAAVRRGLARVPWVLVPEWLVLVAVLAVAGLISYSHLKAVWTHAGSPWPYLGPLAVDGLFAAAWLRMRRRRTEGVAVGWLAWAALGLALAATVAGNVAAAWIAGHRDQLSLVVAAWPALAFGLVWELVTGHGTPTTSRPSAWRRLADAVGSLAASWRPTAPVPVTWESRRDELLAAGVGRTTLMRELGLNESQARTLLDRHKITNGVPQ